MDFLRHLKLRSVEDTMADFVRHVNASPETDWPIVTLTVGAHSYIGTPIKLDRVGQEQWLVLFHSKASAADALSFLPIRAITGYSVMNPGKFVSLLTEPGEWNFAAAPSPGKLEVERKLKSVSAAINMEIAIEWGSADPAEGARVLGLEILTALEGAVRVIAGDSMGREALGSVKKFVVVFGPERALHAERAADTIRLEFGYSLKRSNLAENLRSELEKLL